MQSHGVQEGIAFQLARDAVQEGEATSSITATATFWGVFVTVGVVDDGGGHIFGHFCQRPRQ